MRKLFLLPILLVSGVIACGQADKSKRPSPPAKVSETTTDGTTISIDYSQPAVKGREIGKELAPYGKVWRTGANEATVFEVSKDVKVEGMALPAGKYGLYTIPGADEWVIIFNRTWDQWGTRYNKDQDALRVSVKPVKAPKFTERMTFDVNKNGIVSLLWGDVKVDFKVSGE